MMKSVYKRLTAQFKLPLDHVATTGTTIKANGERKPEASQIIWTFERHVVIDTHPQHVAQFEAIIEDGVAITLEEIARICGVRVLEPDNMYTITDDHFVPQRIQYSMRQLSPDDSIAFTAFLAHCSAQDRDYGQVGLDDETIYGVFDGARIIAAASTLEWRGFVDVGVLTDPDYRGQGAGRAVVAAVVKHYLDNNEERLLLYRHETSNIGSGKIAKAVGWQRFVTVDFLRFEEITG